VAFFVLLLLRIRQGVANVHPILRNKIENLLEWIFKVFVTYFQKTQK